MKILQTFTFTFTFTFTWTVVAAAQIVAITNARIHPVSGPIIERGTVVMQNGRITAVGANASVPAGAQTIDAQGKP
jgi:imidazolonepropionase-like amidohydrolase